MKRTQFARVIRSLDAARSRREALTALLGGLPGLFLTAGPDATSAANGKKGRRRRRKDRRRSNGPCGDGDKEGKGCRCKNVGEACADDASCCPRSKGLSCQEGTCQPCDVCLSGCAFDSVQAAIDAAAPEATIQICAGVFAERLVIAKDVTLIGAGDGANGTTLDGRRGGTTVTVGKAAVTIERLRITGGGGAAAGGGAFVPQGGFLQLTNCTVAGNSADSIGGIGGGVAVEGGALGLDNSRVTGNAASLRGGGIFQNGGATRLTASVVSDNEAVDRGGGLYQQTGAMTLNSCLVENNRAEIEGGGIFREGGALSLREGTVVTGNEPDNCVGIPPIGNCVNS